MATGRPPITTQSLREDAVLDELASVFDTEASAASLLERTGVPRERVRPFGQMTPVEFWESVCRELERGLIPGGPAALLEAAAGLYPHNDAFQRALRRDDEEASGPLARKLEELYDRREERTIVGDDTRSLDREIRDVRGLLRKGPQFQPGEFLLDGRFKLVETLGHGGFATVWKAYDRQLKRLVAVKLLHGQHSADRSKRERFFRGARKMGELVHPNVVGVVERELEDDGWLFFVMELVEGEDFYQAVLGGRLSLDEKIGIVLQVGEALEFAHQRGIVHRDVKPANVLLDENLRAKLTDFDLVRAEDTGGHTATQAMMGTLLFAAPEALAAAREAGPPADVYSLGSTAVFALRGKALPPDYYRAPWLAVAELDVSAELKDVLARATAPEATERFASVRELCQALERARLGKDQEVEAAVPAPASPVTSPTRIWLLAAGLAVALGFAAWKLWPPADPDTEPPPAVTAAPPTGTEPPPPAHLEGELWTESVLGMKLRFIPAGTFQMGSPTTEDGRYDDETQHEVELTRGFWIGETEVTQRQWEDLVETNPSRFKACGEDCPVERVSWFDAVTFANLLSDKTGLEKCYELDCTGKLGEQGYTCEDVKSQGPDCEGYRLPTEAEWEYAARARVGTAYYSPNLNEIAWYSENSGGTTHRVGDKKANDWNLNDMSGNVWEWCGDAYGTYPDTRQDPFQHGGSRRVIRGGSWSDFARYARAASRIWDGPGGRDDGLGFRLARGQGE